MKAQHAFLTLMPYRGLYQADLRMIRSTLPWQRPSLRVTSAGCQSPAEGQRQARVRSPWGVPWTPEHPPESELCAAVLGGAKAAASPRAQGVQSTDRLKQRASRSSHCTARRATLWNPPHYWMQRREIVLGLRGEEWTEWELRKYFMEEDEGEMGLEEGSSLLHLNFMF